MTLADVVVAVSRVSRVSGYPKAFGNAGLAETSVALTMSHHCLKAAHD